MIPVIPNAVKSTNEDSRNRWNKVELGSSSRQARGVSKKNGAPGGALQRLHPLKFSGIAA
jgi:hypothetical protein